MSVRLDGLRILLIDDDMDYSETLHTGLHAAGAEIGCAGTVAGGVTLLEQRASDLVLLNISGSIDARAGLDALSEQTVPVLLITGSTTNSEDTVSGLEHGADDYLMKPFTIQELCSRIADIMEGYDSSHDTVLLVGDLLIDRVGKTVLCQEQTLEMPEEELALLSLLATKEEGFDSEAALMRAFYGERFDALVSGIASRLAKGGSTCQLKRKGERIALDDTSSS